MRNNANPSHLIKIECIQSLKIIFKTIQGEKKDKQIGNVMSDGGAIKKNQTMQRDKSGGKCLFRWDV